VTVWSSKSTPISGVAGLTQAPISEYLILVSILTPIGCHPILYLILTPISGVAGLYIGIPDIGPDIEPDIGYAVHDIDDKMARYRIVPNIGTNIGVNVTRYRVSSDMTRYRVTREIQYP
jgi:hypothetical protein